MGYLFDHTSLFEPKPVYIIPLLIMLATFVFCIVRVRKLKKEAMELRAKLSSEIADDAFNEPMMTHTLAEEAPAAENNK